MNKRQLFSPQSPMKHNELDMSSIQDNDNDQDRSINSDINIQQMGLRKMEELEDQQKFKANIQELLCTDRQFFEEDFIGDKQQNKNNTSQSQFEGEPLKGSFLRDMQALGKTISFQSTCYNIYEGYCENQQILSFLKEQKNNSIQQIQKLTNAFKKLVKSPIQIELKYIVDFSKAEKKLKKQGKCSKKKHPNKSKIFSELQNSTNSFSNCIQRPCSQKKQKMKSNKKNSKNIQDQHRSSQLSWNYNTSKLKKGSSSLLKKVRYNSTAGDLLKTRKSQLFNPSLFVGQKVNKQQKKKKIEQKLNLRTKKA